MMIDVVFNADAWKLPARPCVWCGRDCWNEWQQCSRCSRLHPWHQPSWWKMLARLRMHESWARKYALRHPEHAGKPWPLALRTERLRWYWAGRGPTGWKPEFATLWGLSCRPNRAH